MGSKFLKNSFYNVIAGAVRIGLALITIPVLIRLLKVEGYGVWALASAIVELVVLSGNGLSVTTTVFVSRDLAQTDSNDGLSKTFTIVIGGTLILATLAAFALWISAGAIVEFFPDLKQIQKSAVTQAVQIGGLVVWARLLQQVLIGIEQAYQRYGTLNFLNTLQWVMLSLGLIGVAWLGGRTGELMQWQAITSVVMLVSHLWFVTAFVQSTHLRPILAIKKGLEIAHHSFINWLICLGSVAFGRGDRLIVAASLGPEAIGIYAAIIEATSALSSFAALPVQPLVPVLSHQSALEDTNRSNLKQQIKQALKANGLVALGCSGLLIIVAPVIMQLLLTGAATGTHIVLFKVAVIIYALCSLNAVGFYILLSMAVNLVMFLQLGSGILALILIAIGGKYFGLLGAIVGNIGFFVSWLMILYGLKELKLSSLLWLKCLAFPLSWFVACVLFSFLISTNLSATILTAIIQILVLIGWFLMSQPQYNQFLTKRIRP